MDRFSYNLQLAWRGLRKHRVLTALMVLAIALGIGTSMTTVTVLHVLTSDPLPGLSEHIYTPQLDPFDMTNYAPGMDPSSRVTWTDGWALLQAARAPQQALMTPGMVPVQLDHSAVDPFQADAMFTTAGFFSLFGAPFQYGHAWTAQDDEAHARQVVISSALNQRLFAGQNSVGKTVRLEGALFTVVGVLGGWHPSPRFYDIYMGSYDATEDVFVPLRSARELHMPHEGGMDCWGGGAGDQDHLEVSRCVWLQLWLRLDSPTQVDAYRQYVIAYSQQQHAAGRFMRPPNVRVRDIADFLSNEQIVPDDARLQVWLGLGFLVACLVNTVGLMLAKFMRRGSELSVRRALGASRGMLFGQLLVEAGLVGLVGGAGGVVLAFAGLWIVRHQQVSYAELAHMDAGMLGLTWALALAASLVAGAIPAWRACRITPALQLKGG